MRDAIGGLVNLVIIVVFLVIVSGYLAFNVNYTKAFRVKNKIISTIEEYEGNCPLGSACQEKIDEYISKIGYDKSNPPNVQSDDPNIKYDCSYPGYCIAKVQAGVSGEGLSENNDKYYYKVVTQITIDIPIINKVMANLRVFRITGDTKTITVRTK